MTPERLEEIRALLDGKTKYPRSPYMCDMLRDLLSAYDALTKWRERGRLGEVISLPYREQRADALAHHVLEIVKPFLHDNRAYTKRDASRALCEAFYNSGVEVITDADRALAGLRPRNHMGLTREELQALEMHRLNAMLRPMLPVHFPPPDKG